jgi:hypothetical protein
MRQDLFVKEDVLAAMTLGAEKSMPIISAGVNNTI